MPEQLRIAALVTQLLQIQESFAQLGWDKESKELTRVIDKFAADLAGGTKVRDNYFEICLRFFGFVSLLIQILDGLKPVLSNAHEIEPNKVWRIGLEHLPELNDLPALIKRYTDELTQFKDSELVPEDIARIINHDLLKAYSPIQTFTLLDDESFKDMPILLTVSADNIISLLRETIDLCLLMLSSLSEPVAISEIVASFSHLRLRVELPNDFSVTGLNIVMILHTLLLNAAKNAEITSITQDTISIDDMLGDDTYVLVSPISRRLLTEQIPSVKMVSRQKIAPVDNTNTITNLQAARTGMEMYLRNTMQLTPDRLHGLEIAANSYPCVVRIRELPDTGEYEFEIKIATASYEEIMEGENY